MKKSRVGLELFKSAVLPMLQQKHAGDIAAMQKAINEEYEIFTESDDGKETAIDFVLSKPAAKHDEKQGDIQAIVKAAVAEAIKELPIRRAALMPEVTDRSKFTVPAECKRFGSLKNFARKEVGGLDAEARAYRFGMWAMAAMGRPKAMNWCQQNGLFLVEDTKTVHSEGTNFTGGVLVPEEFGTDMIDLRERYGVVRRLFKNVPMMSDQRSDPRRVTGLTAYFTAENAAGTESNKTWDSVTLVAKDLMVLSRMSNQLSEDAVINVGDDLAGEISYAFTNKEDNCGFIGDGTSTYGGIVGVSNKLGTLNGVDDGGGMILASGNLLSEFTLADFNRVVGAVPQYALQSSPVWVASTTVYYGTMQRLELAAGGVTSMEVRAGNLAPRPLFLGFPVEFSQVMPVADANSRIQVLFGAFQLAASFGDRRLDSIAFSDSATIGGESVFERNQVAIRGTERFDINVHDVGTSAAAGPVVCLISASA